MNIERLNINVNGIPANGFSGNDAVFREVEQRVGGTLPIDYLEFIRQADGGHPEVGSFYPQDGDPKNIFSVDWFYTFANPGVENIKGAIEGWGSLLGNKALPIARDAGGNQVYLALDNSVPSVWLYLHDENELRVKLANNFKEFIDGLFLNPDFI